MGRTLILMGDASQRLLLLGCDPLESSRFDDYCVRVHSMPHMLRRKLAVGMCIVQAFQLISDTIAKLF